MFCTSYWPPEPVWRAVLTTGLETLAGVPEAALAEAAGGVVDTGAEAADVVVCCGANADGGAAGAGEREDRFLGAIAKKSKYLREVEIERKIKKAAQENGGVQKKEFRRMGRGCEGTYASSIVCIGASN